MALNLHLSLLNSSINKEKFCKLNSKMSVNNLLFEPFEINYLYSLGWIGVAEERQFSAFFLDFFSKPKFVQNHFLVTLKQAQKLKNSGFFVIGMESKTYGREHSIKFTTKDELKKGTGNVLKIKTANKRDKQSFFTQYKIYKIPTLRTLNSFYPVLELIGLGRWTGGNGLKLLLVHSESTIQVFDQDDIEKNIPLLTLEEDEFERLKRYVDLYINKLNYFLDVYDDKIKAVDFNYIAKHNLTTLEIFKIFLNEQISELEIYYG